MGGELDVTGAHNGVCRLTRFYKRVGIKEVAEVREGPSYEVTLDGYSLKTPGTEKPYRLPSKGLALAMALEWDQQVRQQQGEEEEEWS